MHTLFHARSQPSEPMLAGTNERNRTEEYDRCRLLLGSPKNKTADQLSLLFDKKIFTIDTKSNRSNHCGWLTIQRMWLAEI